MTPNQLRAGAEQSRKVAQELEQKVGKAGVSSDRMMGILAIRDLFQGVGQVLDAMAEAAPPVGKNAGKV